MESIDVSSMFFEKTSMFAHIESSFVWMTNWHLSWQRGDQIVIIISYIC